MPLLLRFECILAVNKRLNVIAPKKPVQIFQIQTSVNAGSVGRSLVDSVPSLEGTCLQGKLVVSECRNHELYPPIKIRRPLFWEGGHPLFFMYVSS